MWIRFRILVRIRKTGTMYGKLVLIRCAGKAEHDANVMISAAIFFSEILAKKSA
jgi:hypothetical protein